MLVYVWNTVITKLQMKMFENFQNYDQSYYDKLTGFSPNSPQYMANIFFYDEMQPVTKYALWFNSIYLMVLLVGFILIMNLRTDKGS